jgi:uncharacterized protein involved in exopolysaccharide biosynthesis/Mrp family chromosome partitioning ATPase
MSPVSSKKPSLVDEIDFRDYWSILLHRRIFVLSIFCAVPLIAVIVVFLLPKIYQGKTTLLPLVKPAMGMPGALSELTGSLPFGSFGSNNPTEHILAILNSRTLAEDVIESLNLLPQLFPTQWDTNKQQWQVADPPTMYNAVRLLRERVSIVSDTQTGVVSITAEHTDPKLAAAIANQYIYALQRILNVNAFSLAKKQRLFIESQLAETRRELVVAEEALRDFEQTHNIIALDVQASAAVGAIASLESQIMAKEVQLTVLQRLVTGASQEVTLLQEELQGLRTQLAHLQHASQLSRPAGEDSSQPIRSFPSLSEAPEIKLQYARLQRESLVQNKLFALLTQQLAQARIDESRDETTFQILDEAIPPESKSKPKSVLIVILSTVVGAFISIFGALFWEYVSPVIHTRKQIELQLGLPLLATISLRRSRWRRQKHRVSSLETNLILHRPADHALLEAYRLLYARLRQYNDGKSQSILFVNPDPDDVTPTILVNLGIVAAAMGQKTLLVDGNIREPTLHRLLHCFPSLGLTDVMSHSKEWQKCLQITSIDNLHLFAISSETPAAPSLLEMPTVDAAIASCKEVYDLILCTAPSMPAFTEAVLLSRKVDATCLILSRGVSRVDAVTEAKTVLESVQAKVIGAVLTDVRPGRYHGRLSSVAHLPH